MLAFIQARLDAGALSVTQDQVFAAVVPPNHPEFPAGVTHYFIGDYPTRELRRSIGLNDPC